MHNVVLCCHCPCRMRALAVFLLHWNALLLPHKGKLHEVRGLQSSTLHPQGLSECLWSVRYSRSVYWMLHCWELKWLNQLLYTDYSGTVIVFTQLPNYSGVCCTLLIEWSTVNIMMLMSANIYSFPKKYHLNTVWDNSMARTVLFINH